MTRAALAIFLGLIVLAVLPMPAGAAPATCRGTAAVIADKLTCLRERTRCQRKLDRTYARYGYRCRKPRRRGAAPRLTLGDPVKRRRGEPYAIRADGTVDKTTALQLFSHVYGPLPGVKVPKGAIGRVTDANSAVRHVERHRRSLTARQRAAVDRLLARERPQASATAYDETVAEAELKKAIADLERHLGEKLTLTPDVVSSPFAAPGGAYGRTTRADGDCDVIVYKDGQALPDEGVRSLMRHEALHCFQLQWNPTGYTKVAEWLWEGSAAWAEAVINKEHGDADADVTGYWRTWLLNPGTPLFNRAYSALGFFALIERSGVNPWTVLPAMVKAPSNAAAYAVVTGGPAGERLLESWGPSYFRRPELGASWEIDGPLIPPAGTRPPVPGDTIRTDETTSVWAWAESAEQRDMGIGTEVVKVEVDKGVRGRLSDVSSHEYPLANGDFCARPAGCKCPDGRPGPPRLLTGDALVGVIGHAASGRARFTGQSLEDWCGSKPSSIGISGAVGGTITRVGTCGVSGSDFVAVFEMDGSPRHLLQLDTSHWRGPGSYTAATFAPAGRVTFGDGLGRSWETDRKDAPGGSFQVTGETPTQFKGSVSAGMLGGDGSSVSASGSWTCDKT